jgi:hypothetical protein
MSDTIESVRRRSAQLCRVVTVLWTGALLLVLLERFSAAGIHAVSAGFSGEALRRLASEIVSAIPETLFLAGLWDVRRALTGFARGDLFGPSITRVLDRVGLFLAVGSLARIALVPGVCGLLGFGPGYWIAFDASAMVLGAIGLSLRALALVLQHASALQAELDEIF